MMFIFFQITWIDGHGNVLSENIEYIVEPLADGRKFTAKSVLKLMPRKHHHNTTFTCQAQNAADKIHQVAKLKLEVKYAPKVCKQFSQVVREPKNTRSSGLSVHCQRSPNSSVPLALILAKAKSTLYEGN